MVRFSAGVEDLDDILRDLGRTRAALIDLVIGHAPVDLLEGHPAFQAGQCRAETEVDSQSE